MNADQFYKEIQSLKPTINDFNEDNLEIADIVIRYLTIKPLSSPFEAMPNDPVLDLIGRYDVSTLCIQVFEFFAPEGAVIDYLGTDCSHSVVESVKHFGHEILFPAVL